MGAQNYNRLKNWFTGQKKVLVALSGGVDSSLLAKVAFDALNLQTKAITGISSTLSADERNDSAQICKWIGINHIEIQTDEMDNHSFVQNDSLRCYHCKKELFEKCLQWASSRNFSCIVEGTHQDDLKGHRPGYQAGVELGIRSPFVELKFGKKEIRELAHYLRLPNWNKPALACLSSRFPSGIAITEKELSHIEQCEKYLREFGLKQFRVRYHGDLLRLEVSQEDTECIFKNEHRNQILNQLQSLGFKYITLDLKPFRSEKWIKELELTQASEQI